MAPADHSTYDDIVLYTVNPDGTSSVVTDQYVQMGGYDKGSVEFTSCTPGTYFDAYRLYVQPSV